MPELSEEVAGEGLPADDTTTEEVVIEEGGEAGGSEAGNPDAEFEAEATEMGWVPQSEWKGPPEQWRSAKEFVDRGKTILPIVRSQLEKTKAELATKTKEFEERMARYERMSAKALDRQREKLEAEFEERRMRAVELGDTEGFKALQKEEKAALAELDEVARADEPEVKKADQPRQFTPAEQAVYELWSAENDWFNSDREMTKFADDAFAAASQEMKGASLAKLLVEVRKRVADKFPAQFGGGQTRRAPTVEGGARIPGGGQGGRLAAKLPAEAKAAGQKFVDQGLFKSLEDYAKTYFEDEA